MIIALTLLLALSLISCEDKDVILIKLRVNSFTQNRTSEAPQQGLLVQRGEQIGYNNWEFFYNTFKGFEYESRFVYDLLVEVRTINSPPADASILAYN